MRNVRPRIGIMAVGRETFDVSFAERNLDKAWESVNSLDAEIVGEKKLLFSAEQAREYLRMLAGHELDVLLLIQATFTDAAMTVETARAIGAPLVMWSFPEPRTGGRLRLNSFCGVNLAAHALSRVNLGYAHVHGLPDDQQALVRINALARAGAVKNALNNCRLAVVGDCPDGFDACDYKAAQLRDVFGVSVDGLDLDAFIESVKAVPDETAKALLAGRKKVLCNLDELELEPMLGTFKIYQRMHELVEKGYRGVAVRCWPEFFTKFGAAACGAVAMLNEHDAPGGCEADVYGVLTSLVLEGLSKEPAFNTDLVDVDFNSDTCVFWHCGQAPLQMADTKTPPRGTVHSNRKLPLLNEFALKPGRFTIARISRGHGKLRLVIGGGEMLPEPLAFSGTAGVARLDSPIGDVVEKLMREGLEHHTALTYGEHRPALKCFAELIGLDVVELSK